MGVMGQVDAPNGRNLKPQQFDDGLSEFTFPVGVAEVDIAIPTERVENGNATVPLRDHADESPKKMPPASPKNGGRATARVSEPEPEIRKHVVAESESKIPSPVLAPSAPQRKVLTSNPSFKSLVTLLGEPVRSSASVERREGNGEVKKDKNAEVMEYQSGNITAREKLPLATPSSKRLSGILSRVNAKIAAQAADSATKTPERVNSAVSVNVLVEKLSAGARAVSPNLGSRTLTSPRPVLTADRCRSPISRQLQESHPITPRAISSPRRGVPVQRSVSPVQPRSWKDSVFGDMSMDRRPSFSKSGPTTPPPRFLTSTQAAATKAVANPGSKSLQFTTAFGITTPLRATTSTTVMKTPAAMTVTKPAHAVTVTKPAHAVTKPAVFNFRTDERAERRRDYFSKQEERYKVKETERRRAELKALEEEESQLRELRKSLTYKANPVPRFYQEPAPAPAELRKSTPTRPKSPNFITMLRRRDSCPATTILSELGRTSPLRSSRPLVRCESVQAPVLKPKQPFRPV